VLVRCVWCVQAGGVLHLLCSGCVCSALARGIWSSVSRMPEGTLSPVARLLGAGHGLQRHQTEHQIWITTRTLKFK